MRYFFWVSCVLILFTACTPVGLASTFNIPEGTQPIEKIEILMDIGSLSLVLRP